MAAIYCLISGGANIVYLLGRVSGLPRENALISACTSGRDCHALWYSPTFDWMKDVSGLYHLHSNQRLFVAMAILRGSYKLAERENYHLMN